MRTPPAAVLWDMDGTLIDTEPLWMAAESTLVAAHGGVWTAAQAVAMIGSPMAVAGAHLRAAGVELEDAEIIAALNAQVRAGVAAETPWRPGALAALARLRAAGVPQALVTSSFGELAYPFADTAQVFDVVVAGDEVVHAKPHPEPYRRAAELLGVPVEACIAVEDSRSGVAAALASGARTVAVDGHQVVPDDARLSRTGHLDALSLDVLARLVAGEVLDLR
ncbi:HAD family hydrolase [Cellulomonas composti]|uniref:HAD family hydrolase n=1 Tax=Cellulomonas composti TaxID=266130 RepID=UPI0027D95FE7|nr:HAD family phosphatase [Cellulomonas composti]